MISEIDARKSDIHALCRRHHVRRLELFGSAAVGASGATVNDLDFLVEFDDRPEGGYADAYFGLLEALEDLFRLPVDLVVGSAIKNPYFRQSVEKTRTLLYAT
jgi:predicted nucleotidyltransferase